MCVCVCVCVCVCGRGCMHVCACICMHGCVCGMWVYLNNVVKIRLQEPLIYQKLFDYHCCSPTNTIVGANTGEKGL